MTANNRPWTQPELDILTLCLDNGWSSGQAALRLPGRTDTSCRDKAMKLGRPFGGREPSPPEPSGDAAYVRRCIAAWPFGFGRTPLREVTAEDLRRYA